MMRKVNVTMQGVGDISRTLNEIRANTLSRNLYIQNMNFEQAMNSLDELRTFVGNPDHILGSAATKHGEIAEHMQVAFENADNLIIGKVPSATFENVGRTAPEDYLRNNLPVQSKFVQNNLSMDAVTEHLKKYPDFLARGGSYDIPRDFYYQINAWLKLSPEELSKIPASEGGRVARNVVSKVRELEASNNVEFADVIHPSQLAYNEVQINCAGTTIDGKEQEIIKIDGIQREKYVQMSKATVKEGIAAAGIAAVIDGVISFGSTLMSKFNLDKKLSELNDDDWRDILKETGIGVVRGGTTGGGIYALTNCAGMSAPLAASIVTATIGVITQAIQLGKGNISFDDFMYNILDLSTDAAVSGLGAFVGQLVIPVPVVGAIVGSLVSTGILKVIKEKGFGGSYYQLLAKAEYEAKYSANYRLLIDTMDRCSREFEYSALQFCINMNRIHLLEEQSRRNLEELNNYIKSI